MIAMLGAALGMMPIMTNGLSCYHHTWWATAAP